MEKNRSSYALSIVIPVYNEERSVRELYDRIKAAVDQITGAYELIFVNDGSKDNSLLEIIRLSKMDNRVFYIDFSRNFGHQIAVSSGLDLAAGDAVIIIDGDLQDPPELIPDLYKAYVEGYDVVYAQRKKRKGESLFKKLSAKLFYRFLKFMTSIEIPLDTGDFRLIDRKVVDYLKLMPEQNKFLRGQIAWLGFNQTSVLFDRDERRHGSSGYSLKRMIQFALDGITSFSDVPLRVVSQLGFIISFVSFLIILYALYAHFVMHQTITGWTSLIISSMFIGGIQLISIGIIGTYISRINKNILGRPLYIIQSTNIKRGHANTDEKIR